MTASTAGLGLPPHAFDRLDESDDVDFYAPARLVTHIDDRAITALTAAYRELVPPGARVLDLMSSWVSHLPPDVAYAEVVGHGMNAEELAANPRLARWWVQDLNPDPSLPLESASFDAAMICVSIQYLIKPVELLADVARVLRPGGVVLVSFSNRCFPTKAVAVWRALAENGHAHLVSMYQNAAGFSKIEVRPLLPASGGDPLILVVGRNKTHPAD